MNSQNSNFNSNQGTRGQWVPPSGSFAPPIHPSDLWPINSNNPGQIFRHNYNVLSPFSDTGPNPNDLLFAHQHQSGSTYTTAAPSAPVIPDAIFGLEDTSTKTPTFANILHNQNEDTLDSEPRHPTRQVRRRRPRTNRILQKDWEKYKDYIRKLYLEKEYTLLQIKDEMERDFNFVASEQVYKNKMVEWGFFKNKPRDLPSDVSQWIIVKDQERQQDGKKTEFEYKHRILPLHRIKESAKRSKISHEMVPADTPKELKYYTPRNYEIAYPSPFRIGSASPRQPNTASGQWIPAPGPQVLNHLHLRLTWNGYSRQELDEMRADAQELSKLERYEEAEHKLREALAGYEHLLSPTHEETLNVAYELAEFYAHHNQMNDADNVLDWLTEHLITTWGPRHAKYIKHLVQITDLFRKWSRTNDAVTMMLRATEVFDGHTSTLPQENGKTHVNPGSFSVNKVQKEKHKTISRFIDLVDGFGEKDSTRTLEIQLGIANAQIKDHDEDAESLILGLIEQCQVLPDKFEAQLLKAHAALIDLYDTLGKVDQLESALADAQESFAPIMKRPGRKVISLLDAAIDLAGLFVKVGRYKEADEMFCLVEDTVSGAGEEDQVDNEIDFLVDIGMLYQKHDRWNDARPRFEHALAVSLAARGLESRTSRRLQAALDDRHFSMSALTTTEHKSSLRKRLMS